MLVYQRQLPQVRDGDSRGVRLTPVPFPVDDRSARVDAHAERFDAPADRAEGGNAWLFVVQLASPAGVHAGRDAGGREAGGAGGGGEGNRHGNERVVVQSGRGGVADQRGAEGGGVRRLADELGRGRELEEGRFGNDAVDVRGEVQEDVATELGADSPIEPERRHERGRVQRDDGVPGHDSLQVPHLPLALRRQDRHIRHRRDYNQVRIFRRVSETI